MGSSRASHNGASFDGNNSKVSGLKKTASLKLKALGNKVSGTSRPPPSDVPSGTVASRVSYLHSLAASSHNIASTAHYPPPYKGSEHARSVQRQIKNGSEDDRGGYGRRMSSKFGYPATRSSEPQEDPLPEETSHRRFRKRDWRRKKSDDDIGRLHEKERRLRQKVKQAIKHEHEPEPYATPFYGPTPRTSVSVKSRAQEYEQAAARSRASSSAPPVPPDTNQLPAPFAVLLSANVEETQQETVKAEPVSSDSKIKAWLAEAGPSTTNTKSSEPSGDNSEATTSTHRVRSVQQLYNSYGIEEPPELFTGRAPSSVAQSSPESQRFCHVCSWKNGDVERCACCGHRLCEECRLRTTANDLAVSKKSVPFAIYEDAEEDDTSPARKARIEAVAEDDTPPARNMHRETIADVLLSSDFEQKNWPKHFPSSTRPRAISSRQSPKTRNKESFSMSTLPITSLRSSFEIAATQPLPLSVTTSRKTSKTAAPKVTVEEEPVEQDVPAEPLHIATPSTLRSVSRVLIKRTSPPRSILKVSPELSAIKKKSMVKYSPFLKADQGSPSKPPKPWFKKSVMVGLQRSESDKMITEEKSVASVQPTNSPQMSNECESIGCKATHTGHRPYRHSISCTLKRSQGGQGSRLDVSTPPTDIHLSLTEMASMIPKPLTPRHTMRDPTPGVDRENSRHSHLRSIETATPLKSDSKVATPMTPAAVTNVENPFNDRKQPSTESPKEDSFALNSHLSSPRSISRHFSQPRHRAYVYTETPVEEKVKMPRNDSSPRSNARIYAKPLSSPSPGRLLASNEKAKSQREISTARKNHSKRDRDRRHHRRQKYAPAYAVTQMPYMPPLYSHHVLHTIQYIECLGHSKSKSKRGINRRKLPLVRRPDLSSGDYYCGDGSSSSTGLSYTFTERSSIVEVQDGISTLQTTPRQLRTDVNRHDGSHDEGAPSASPAKSSPLRSMTDAIDRQTEYQEDVEIGRLRANFRSPSPLLTGQSRFVENLDESMPSSARSPSLLRTESRVRRSLSSRSPVPVIHEEPRQIRQSRFTENVHQSPLRALRSSRTIQGNEGRVNHLASFWASRTNTMSPPLQRSNAIHRRHSKLEEADESHDSQLSDDPPVLHHPPGVSETSEDGTQTSSNTPRKLQKKRLKVHGSSRKPKNYKLGRHVVERARAQSPRPHLSASRPQTPVPKLQMLKDQLIAAGSRVQSAVPSRTVTRRRVYKQRRERSVYEAPAGVSTSGSASRQEMESFSVVQHYGQAHDGPAESNASSGSKMSRLRQMPGSWTEEVDEGAMGDILDLYATLAV